MIFGPNIDRSAFFIIAPMRSHVWRVKRADSALATATISVRRDRLDHLVKMDKTALPAKTANLDSPVCPVTIRRSTTITPVDAANVPMDHPDHQAHPVHQAIPDPPDRQAPPEDQVDQVSQASQEAQAVDSQVAMVNPVLVVRQAKAEARVVAVNQEPRARVVDRDRKDRQALPEIQAAKDKWVVQAPREMLDHQANAVLQAQMAVQAAHQHRAEMLSTAHVRVVRCFRLLVPDHKQHRQTSVINIDSHQQNIRKSSMVKSSFIIDDLDMNKRIRQHSIMLIIVVLIFLPI